ADARGVDDRTVSVSLWIADDRYPNRCGLRTRYQRMAHATVPEGSRLQNRDHWQMASGPRGQEILAEAARLRLPVRRNDRPIGLLPARRARRARLVSRKQTGQRRRLHDDAAWQ